MKSIIYFFALISGFSSFAQKEDASRKYSQFIDSVDLKKHLSVLASDAFEGRETGKKGQKMAAEYIINEFKEDGCALAPGMTGWEQYYDVIETSPSADLSFGKTELKFKTDFIYYGAKQKMNWNALPVYTKESAAFLSDSPSILMHNLKGNDVRTEITELKKNLSPSVQAIILVTKNYAQLYEYLEHYVTSRSMRLADEETTKKELPIFIVRSEALTTVVSKPFVYLLGKKGKSPKLKKAVMVTECSANINKEDQRLTSSNILAFIPGNDPILSKEIVVITAHYDHIGIDNGVVFNGADDDGTGTVALLEIAEAFMKAAREGNGPRRSILIMPVSGEEKGLLGSLYYSNHPVIPLDLTIADLNIDMIGRNDIAHEKNSNYIYIIGSDMISSDLHDANEKANREYTNITLDYKFNSKTDPNQFYYRSDHYNFAKNNIPSVFYFSGVHEDYHQATDDVEKINFTKVEKVARLVFHTAWNLANETKRPRMNY